MNNQKETSRRQREASLRVRFAVISLIALFIALASAIYIGGSQAELDGDLLIKNAVLILMVLAISCAVVLAIYLSVRTKNEQKHLDHIALFEAMVHSSIDGILVVDSEGKKIFQNQRMRELWKIPQEIADDPDDSKQVQFVLGRVMEPQAFADKVAYLYSHADETSLDEIALNDGTILERYSAPVRGSDGRYYGRVWTFRDITDYRRKERRFRCLVESNVQGIFCWNTDGSIFDFNDAFLQLIGYTREDLDSGLISLRDLTPPEYEELDRAALKEVQTRGICTPYEKEFIRKDKVRVPIIIGAAAFEDTNEGVCLVLDLTERKKLEQQFLRIQRMESISTLAGGIAHDLNNVFAPIMMSLELLQMKISDPDGKQLLAMISSSAQHGADVVRQILSFGRVVEGRRMELQVTHLIRDIEKIANDTFLKNITVQTQLPKDLWTVLGDPAQLHQALLNVCVNSRDAMSTGGMLTLSAQNLLIDAHFAALNTEARPGPYVQIQIQDTGTGMSPEVIKQIFDPFFTTKEIGKGAGLGLSTALGIVKSHGGFIQVYSEPEKGTTFRIHLPAQIEDSAKEEAKFLQELPRGNGELILVVDDEATVREITKQTLEVFGYRVVLANDGAEAVSVYSLRGAEIDLVLTDMMMPVMDGLAMIEILRRINPEVLIIGASGLSVESQVARATSLGVKDFLPKPYTAETLLKVLKKVLKEK